MKCYFLEIYSQEKELQILFKFICLDYIIDHVNIWEMFMK